MPRLDAAPRRCTVLGSARCVSCGAACRPELAGTLAIVRALAHCHRSATDAWEEITPVTTSKQLAPTNTYVILTGWYKMQCVIVKPEMTIADIKAYLHEKNGSRMPLECIDIGVRSGDDIKIIDDALTVQVKEPGFYFHLHLPMHDSPLPPSPSRRTSTSG